MPKLQIANCRLRSAERVQSAICNLQFAVCSSACSLFIAILLLASFWFRCRDLATIPGINGDEAWYGAVAMDLLGGEAISWRTPPGNPLNPFFFLPVVGLHVFFPPSIALLRWVSVASGVAALGVNWWLCCRAFDRRTAWISTLALAVLPINIAYSRFAWDASQSLLATLPVLYCSLAAVRAGRRFDRWLAGAIVAQVVAVWVHPTNIFVGAAIAAAVVTRLSTGGGTMIAYRSAKGRGVRGAKGDNASQWWPLARHAAILGLATTALCVWAASIARVQGTSPATGRFEQLRHLLQPEGVAQWSARYARLFAGDTAYEFLAGSRSWLRWPADETLDGFGIDVFGWWALVAASAVLCVCSVRPGKKAASGESRGGAPTGSAPTRDMPDVCSAADRALVATWLFQLAAFLVLAGPLAVQPGQERYAMCLIAPGVVLVGRGLALFSRRWPRAWPAAAMLATLLAGIAMADFHEHYFCFIQRTGGQAHDTFRTAAVEPKQAALEFILAHRAAPAEAEPDDEGVAWIAASEWWNYWPLRYLAAGRDDICVVQAEAADLPEEFWRARAEGQVWHVEFSGSQGLQKAQAMLAGRPVEECLIVDGSGRPVLSVLHPVRPPTPLSR
jgi:hypothetical protein